MADLEESIYDCINIGYECILVEFSYKDKIEKKSFYEKIADLALELTEKYGLEKALEAFNRYIF